MKKVVKIVLISLLSIFTIAGGVLLIYTSNPMQPTQEAIDANYSTDEVEVIDTSDYIAYVPADIVECGVVFYPGGKVEPEAYSVLCQKLAMENMLVVTAKMPLNLAMFGKEAGLDIMDEYKDIDSWYLMGHSMGGAFGTFHIQEHSDEYDGMIYLGSYPAADISSLDLPILSITGELDTVVNQERLSESKAYLNDSAVFYEIEGGNHSLFGDYGLQDGDTPAQITSQEQKEIITELVVDFVGMSH